MFNQVFYNNITNMNMNAMNMNANMIHNVLSKWEKPFVDFTNGGGHID